VQRWRQHRAEQPYEFRLGARLSYKFWVRREMSLVGTELTSRDVRYLSAYDAEADMPNASVDFRW
jgi:hypothetical protein